MNSTERRPARHGLFQPQRNIVHRFIAYLMLLSILPLFGLGLASFEIFRSALETEAERHLTQLLRERKRFIDLQTEQIEGLITNISGVETIIKDLAAPYDGSDDYTRLLMQARIGYILNGYVNIKGLVSIDIFAANGAHYHVGETLDVGRQREDMLDAIRRETAASPHPIYWAGIVDNINENSKHAKVITAAKELYGFRQQTSEQIVLGLLVVNYSVDYLREQFGQLGTGEFIQLALVDGKGRLVYHSASARIGSQMDARLLRMAHADSGTFFLDDAGAGMLISHIRSEPSGWDLMGFIPLAAIDAHTTVIGKATALVVLLCLLVVAAAATSFSRQVVAPLRRITDRFKQLRSDRTMSSEHLPVRGENDVAELTAGFNAFLDSLREQARAEKALHASEERFRTIFEGAGIGMAVMGKDRRLTLVNRTLLNTLGYEESELLGKTLAELIPPDASEKVSADLGLPGRPEPGHRFETRFRSKAGQILSVRVTEVLFPETTSNGDHVIAAIEDVTAQKEAEAERRARIAAEAANEAKSMFLARMSHELRTPLNAVLGYAQILMRDKGLDERQTAGMRTIQESGEQLLMLINDILDLSKIEAGKLELYPDTVNLFDFLHGIADIIRVKAEEKSVLFIFDAAAHLPQAIQADAKRLRQILLNLLGNAVKFTDRGSVRFRIRRMLEDGQQVRLRFEIEDTGAGIAADELDTIFHPFEQAGDTSRRVSGTGLGLTISRQLAKLMAGDIQVESEYGRGSRFWLDLDVQVCQARTEASLLPRTIVGYLGPRKTVLVVDDIAANRLMAVNLLQPIGFETVEAENGCEAIDKALAVRPDLILMDVVMPVLNGLEAIGRLRGLRDFDDTPIIAMSARASDADRISNLAVGANAFLPKPIDLDLLLQQIARLTAIAWVYRQEEKPQLQEEHGPMILPPEKELKMLYHMALMGNMRAIQEWAKQLEAKDARYRFFAERLRQLAEGCRSKAILTLAEEAMSENG